MKSEVAKSLLILAHTKVALNELRLERERLKQLRKLAYGVIAGEYPKLKNVLEEIQYVEETDEYVDD